MCSRAGVQRGPTPEPIGTTLLIGTALPAMELNVRRTPSTGAKLAAATSFEPIARLESLIVGPEADHAPFASQATLTGPFTAPPTLSTRDSTWVGLSNDSVIWFDVRAVGRVEEVRPPTTSLPRFGVALASDLRTVTPLTKLLPSSSSARHRRFRIVKRVPEPSGTSKSTRLSPGCSQSESISSTCVDQFWPGVRATPPSAAWPLMERAAATQ